MDVGKIIAYQNLKGESKRVVILEKIGQGSNGTVYKAFLEGYGPIALKYQKLSVSIIKALKTEMRISNVLSDNIAIILRRVLLNTSRGKPSDFVALTDDIPRDYIASLYDLADGLELQNYININKMSKVILTEDVVEKFVRDLLQCLEGLQLAGIAHRDIKPANLILNKGTIIMIDFGFACFYNECEGKKGTPSFLPPEFFFLPEINWQKGDIFAMGITILSLITNGSTLYENNISFPYEASAYFSTINELRLKFEEVLNDYAKTYPLIHTYKELVLGMIDPEPLKRWTIEKCFQWLDEKTFSHVLKITEEEDF